MISNIYIVGAQSTGKTTLTLALVDRIKRIRNFENEFKGVVLPHVITEVARNVMRSHGFETKETFASPERIVELQNLIMNAQLEEEKQVPQGSWYVSDRSGLDPLIYAHTHISSAAASTLASTATWALLQTAMQRSAVFVCEPNMSWVTSDNFRYMPSDHQIEEYFTNMHACFCERLEEFRIPFVVVPRVMESVDERVDLLLREWQKRNDGNRNGSNGDEM